MYNLLRQCSEEKGWQAPTIETIQGNFRTLEYIAWLEKKLDYYKRLADAAGEIALEIEMISDFELSDFNNIKSCRTNLMQIHEAAMKLKSIIKEAGE